jgi:hypothetical protein
MIAVAIVLAVLAAIVVVLLALRPPARPTSGPARQVQPARHTSSGPVPPAGHARPGRTGDRSARHQDAGDG